MNESVHKAADVLAALAESRGNLSARELSDSIQLPRSTVQRLLQALEDTGLVRQESATRKYGLGPRTLELGMAYLARVDVRSEALPHMTGLRDELGETIELAMRVGSSRVYIAQLEARAELKAKADPGRLYPLWAGAAGRVLLASMPRTEITRLAHEAGEVAFGHVTPPTLAGLLGKLDEERRLGYAMAFEETISGVHTVAVPVRVPPADVVVLSASGPATRFGKDLMADAVGPLQRAATAISMSMGMTFVAAPTEPAS
ncbi:MAG: IclR family transcriptional regulator [Streptosporangiales bacterium]